MELKEQLEELKSSLGEMTKGEVKTAVEAFEAKFQAVEEMTNEVKSAFEKEIEDLKKHNAELDVRLQAKVKAEKQSGDAIKNAISENFEEIKDVARGRTVEVKAVGDMLLSTNLTGDQPRDYNFDVVMNPGEQINLSDLAGTVNISGGTYTFVRETGSEGSISEQTQGSSKSQIDYDLSMIDVNTEFIAGFARYSRKMKNNLPFLESFLPSALRRDYFISENDIFEADLQAAATASSLTSASASNDIEFLLAELSALESARYMATGIVINPADWYQIAITEKSTGAGYGLPSVVSIDANGGLRVAGVPVYKATWVDARRYYVGDWSRVKKVVTEGLGLEFSDVEGSNFVKNMITARIEQQCALAVEQPASMIYGNFDVA